MVVSLWHREGDHKYVNNANVLFLYTKDAAHRENTLQADQTEIIFLWFLQKITN